ncbi:MAG: cytochrome c oxidase subunit 3 [Terrimicrobiaceae bacterium]
MNASTEITSDWKLPSPRKVGILSLIVAESALFTIFVVAYLYYMGKSLNGPFPHEVLEFPWLGSIALFGSSGTILAAERALGRGNHRGFLFWWGLTTALGIYFIFFTASEWWKLITVDGLTIDTNTFGTTFYSLVGLHAFHVIVGIILLLCVFLAAVRKKIHPDHHEHVEVISYYWHFVDCIWIVVLTVVYIISTRT